ncbi:hypothetical protein [Actinoplanes sp. NPDC051494]|uniref:hypothetical protein n=1 Tax=Actinoplanes sp. NPDC051494 TaxID=3363907 RepID=UPI0037B60FEB
MSALVVPAPAQAAPGDPEPVTIAYERGLLAGRGDVSRNTSTLAVENTGDDPIYGIRLSIGFPAGFGFAPLPGARNCAIAGESLECYFAVTLAPHTEYTVDVPFTVEDRYPRDSTYNDYYQWQVGGLTNPTTGSGPELALSPAGAPIPAGAPAQKIDAAGSKPGYFIDFKRIGGADPDLAAVAPTGPVTGAVGATVRPTIGARNDGTVVTGYRRRHEDGRPSGSTRFVTVNLPDGVSVLSAPDFCHLRGAEPDDEPYRDKKEFTCNGEKELSLGATAEFPFELRIDEPLTDAKVTVAVALDADRTPANNTASFLINSAEGTGGAPVPTTPAATTPAITTPATGATVPVAAGESLPVTGTPIALVTATGTALATGGGLALLLARRRRTRFTAGG